jgi:hypothetical protein
MRNESVSITSPNEIRLGDHVDSGYQCSFCNMTIAITRTGPESFEWFCKELEHGVSYNEQDKHFHESLSFNDVQELLKEFHEDAGFWPETIRQVAQ